MVFTLLKKKVRSAQEFQTLLATNKSGEQGNIEPGSRELETPKRNHTMRPVILTVFFLLFVVTMFPGCASTVPDQGADVQVSDTARRNAKGQLEYQPRSTVVSGEELAARPTMLAVAMQDGKVYIGTLTRDTPEQLVLSEKLEDRSVDHTLSKKDIKSVRDMKENRDVTAKYLR